MATYKITAEIDEFWFEMLGQITKNQDGFIWCKVNEMENK